MVKTKPLNINIIKIDNCINKLYNHQENREIKDAQPIKEIPTTTTTTTATTLREPNKPHPPVHIETRTSIGSKIEGGTRVEVLAVEERREKELVGDAQPLPAHIHNEV